MNVLDFFRNNRWNISTRLIAYVLPFVLVIAFAVGVLTFLGPTAQLYNSQVEQQMTQLVDIFGQKIGVLLAYKFHALQELTADSQLVNAATTSNRQYAGLTDDEIETLFAEREAAWEAGDELVDEALNGATAQRLRTFQQANAGFGELLVTDANGGVVATLSEDIDYNDSDEIWFTTAAAGTNFISSPERHDEAGEISILIGLPIRNAQSGEVIGTILASYPVATLAEDIALEAAIDVPVRIVNAEGQVVASPFADEVNQPYLLAEQAAQAGDLAGVTATNTEARDVNDNAVIASYAPVTSEGLSPEIDALNWSTWTEVSRAVLFTSLDQNRNTTLIVLIGAMALLLVVVLVVVRYATRDVQQLAQTVERFAQGDLTARVTPQGAREIYNLGTVFNQMAAELQEDIQQLQKNEDASRAQNEALIKANRELAIARKQAEAANKLKSQFLATMSHELRTPLNAIIGYTQLQLAGMVGELNDELRGFQERIFVNAQHLLHLINDVLDLSKIESGRLDLIERPYNLHDCIDEVITQNRVLAETKGLTLDIHVDDRLPEIIVGDRGRVKQVLINLVSNAVKFTDAGTVTVNATLHDGGLRLAVTDTGTGIPSHLQQTIFDEFRQADEGLQRGGTGLGLAIVRRLVLMMDGSIRVASEVGKGSTFTVQLPLLPTPADSVDLVPSGILEA